MKEKPKYTPMMMQYLEIKEQYPDTLILFRLGDFYELFFEDAKIASKVLELVLTGKNAGADEKVPMCGVPYHSITSYIETLIKKGYKVGIVEQLEDPQTVTKGIVKRDVVQIITPGTLINLGLDEKKNNYIAYVDDFSTFFCLAYCDLSTGELGVMNVASDIFLLTNELLALDCKEIVTTPAIQAKYSKDFNKKGQFFITVSEEEAMPLEMHEITASIKDVRQVHTLSKLVFYLTNTQKRPIEYLKMASVIQSSQYLKIDNNSAINLELTRTVRSDDRYGSLCWLLDKTKTAMGARLLKKFINRPLYNQAAIEERLTHVETFTKDYLRRQELASYLNEVYDLERLIAKISYGNANARDLLQLLKSFKVMPSIKKLLQELSLDTFSNQILTLDPMVQKLESALCDNPPLSVKEGGMIKPGYDSTLDDLKLASKDGKNYLANLENKEREKTGIKTLKIGFNKVFGYYIEVTKSYLGAIKNEFGYIRQQTTSNSERFITEELKEKEKFILSADDKIIKLEYEIFNQLRNEVKSLTKEIQQVADVISYLDVIRSFAEISISNHYVKPSFNHENKVEIINGRHPVMEVINRSTNYIPNDVHIDENTYFLLISGPNMGGKSTYMRQVAVAIIMAQMGCFVAADSANLPLFDGIYTRIGASDDMISGQSTFMLEMNEVNYALQHATKNSLIIFDEVGRGTATFDGMALAQAIIEYICLHIQAVTLFSTHYHELTALSSSLKGLTNLHAAVVEENDKVTFLYKMVPGATNKSYGVNVAKLAHLPDSLLDRAKDILLEREKNPSVTLSTIPIIQQVENKKPKEPDWYKELKDFNPLESSPMEALNFIYQLKQKMKEGE